MSFAEEAAVSSDIIAHDASFCIEMIRAGNCSVEAAQDVLSQTLDTCSREIENISEKKYEAQNEVTDLGFALDGVRKDLERFRHEKYWAEVAEASAKSSNPPDEKEVIAQRVIIDAKALQIERWEEAESNLSKSLDEAKKDLETVSRMLDDANQQLARVQIDGTRAFTDLKNRVGDENQHLDTQAELLRSKR